MITIRKITAILVVLLCGWVTLKGYNYFFDNTKPILTVRGMEPDECYAGDIHCRVTVSKPGEISVWLDKKPIISRFKISRSNFETALPIPTKTIPNGRHALEIEMIDGTYKKNNTCYNCDFVVDNTPLQAALIRVGSDNKVFQGRTLHVQIQANKEIREAKVKALSSIYDCYPETERSTIYECFIPIVCEETPNEYPISIEVTDKVGNTILLEDKFQVMAYPFKKQTIQVSSDKMKTEREIGLPTNQLEVQLTECSKASPQKKLWRGSFIVPLDHLRTTCDYGTVRTTQEKGRYAHKALDVVGPLKCVVWAPHDGVVVIKERYVHTGNTVVIDHGLGVLTLLCHLDSFADISVGDKVKQGNPVGVMGRTGYANGDHLHWELRLGTEGTKVDPMQWTKADF